MSTTTLPFAAIVLAAGQGTRMKSALPKVLHPVCGLPLVSWCVRAAREAGATRVVVVVGHGRDKVEAELASRFSGEVEVAIQTEQKGTGHAALAAMPALAGFMGEIAVLCGDTPLLEASAITELRGARRTHKVAMLTSTLHDPTGYGRILRSSDGSIVGVREERDASAAERAIKEWNTGVYVLDAAFLRASLARMTTDNAQGELYLTDVVRFAASEGGAAGVEWRSESVLGVNDRAQLAEVEAIMRARIARRLGVSGVTVRDPATFYCDADVVVEADATIEPQVTLRGRTRVGAGARIDVGCVLDDVIVGAGANLKPYTVAQKSAIGELAQIGPFSHLRPETVLGPDVHVGNFVETKKTSMARGAKANHLAYLGDGVIGERVNVGAGTIFCNYDGFSKHTTTLEEGAFIGSDSQLVAPVRVGKNAYVATGTCVTRDVPDDALAIARTKQQNKDGYAAVLRNRKKAAVDAKKTGKG